jgi:RNA polymerase sigma factor (sigma-70 family)
VTDLLARVADGDRAAFDPLFDAVWPAVHALCRRALGEGNSDDAAQETMVRVFGRAAEFDRERDGLAWILGVAAWQCRTERRTRQRRGEIAIDGAPDPGGGPRPDEAALRRDLLAAAQDALGTLSDADVATITAAITDDPSLREGIAPATFRKRLERALGRLRTAWRSRHGSP